MFANRPCDLAQAAMGPVADDERRPIRIRSLRPLNLRPCRHLVVVSTHLGEDVSAAGGLIAALADRGVRIDLLAVTEDDGSPPGDPNPPPPSLLGQRRAARPLAYRRLGVRACRQDTLKLPAGKVDRAATDVVAALSEIIGFAPGPPDAIWLLAPCRHESHPDHAAVGRAAAIVSQAYRTRLLEYPIANQDRGDPTELPWDTARRLALSPVLHTRKRHALAAYLHPVLAEFVAAHEVYLA